MERRIRIEQLFAHLFIFSGGQRVDQEQNRNRGSRAERRDGKFRRPRIGLHGPGLSSGERGGKERGRSEAVRRAEKGNSGE